MQRTLTIDADDIHIVLTRSTVADARVRQSIIDAMQRLGRRSADTIAVAYLVTQMVECQGLPFQHVHECPSDQAIDAMVDAWEGMDEMLAGQIDTGLVKLREPAAVSEKKVTSTSPNGTSEQVAIPIP